MARQNREQRQEVEIRVRAGQRVILRNRVLLGRWAHLGMMLAVFAVAGTVWADPCAVSGLAGPYVWGKAYHVLRETHNNESGYFSLCEGKDGKIYVGTTKYGVNSYLVEFDPVAETQRVVLDSHATCGLGTTSYNQAQSKVHTRNYVGESGKVYVGTMEGPPIAEDPCVYPGGFMMTYDPISDTTANLGMPYPLSSVIDVVPDEARNILYIVILGPGKPWMIKDMTTGQYTELGPILTDFSSTLIDSRGYASTITHDGKLAQYNPGTGAVTVRDIVADGVMLENVGVAPTWQISPDGRTAYLIKMTDPTLYAIDLLSAGAVVSAENHGLMLAGPNPDSRCSLDVAPNGKVYALIRVDNDTGFGGFYLWHLTRFDPVAEVMDDLGILAVENPQFYFEDPCAPIGHPATNEEHPPYYGYHRLPDGVLTPLYSCMAMIVADDGTVYVTVIYPFTLFRIDPLESMEPPPPPQCGDYGYLLADLDEDCNVNLIDYDILGQEWLTDRTLPATSLAAHWQLDESSGPTTSDSASGHTATLTGWAELRADEGKFGGALFLPGGSHAVATGYKGVGGTAPRSCSAWIKTAVSNIGILSWGAAGTGGKWDVGISAGGFLRVAVGGGYVIGSTSLIDNEWHLVVVVSDGTASDSIELYVDGKLELPSDFGSGSINTGSTYDVCIGSYNDSQHFSGHIDNVRIYDRELTTGELIWPRGDINDDLFVNLLDFWILAGQWGQSNAP